MTTAPNSAILDPVTNPVPTVAPQSKEDTTMSGATNKITALYCRLSQEDARLGESLSIENQKAILLEYAKKNHFPNPVFFVDDGYSGTNYDRPGFQSMLAEIEAGRVGIVITKDLSRLGRNSALTGLYTNFTFPQYGVRYIAINDNYDTCLLYTSAAPPCRSHGAVRGCRTVPDRPAQRLEGACQRGRILGKAAWATET